MPAESLGHRWDHADFQSAALPTELPGQASLLTSAWCEASYYTVRSVCKQSERVSLQKTLAGWFNSSKPRQTMLTAQPNPQNHDDLLPDVHTLEGICSLHDRVCVVGGPGVGKSYMVDEWWREGLSNRPVLRSDSLVHLDWRAQKPYVLEWAAGRPRFVMEGVTVARALRSGLEADAVLWLRNAPRRPLWPGAERLAKQVDGWLEEARKTSKATWYVLP